MHVSEANGRYVKYISDIEPLNSLQIWFWWYESRSLDSVLIPINTKSWWSGVIWCFYRSRPTYHCGYFIFSIIMNIVLFIYNSHLIFIVSLLNMKSANLQLNVVVHIRLVYIYIKCTVFVNVTTKSAQHAHARMIAIIVEKSPNSSHMYDHGFMDNTNRQAVCKSQKNPLSDLQTAEELHWKP